MTSTNRGTRISSFFVLVGILSGCAQVRIIESSSDAGVIAIPSNSNQWPTYYRNRAEVLMDRQFPDGYTIVNEQEVEDNPAARDGRKPNEDFEYNGGYERITKYNRKEYHITFRRGSLAKGAPPPSRPPKKPRPSPPATDASKDELPPPRPVPTEPRP